MLRLPTNARARSACAASCASIPGRGEDTDAHRDAPARDCQPGQANRSPVTPANRLLHVTPASPGKPRGQQQKQREFHACDLPAQPQIPHDKQWPVHEVEGKGNRTQPLEGRQGEQPCNRAIPLPAGRQQHGRAQHHGKKPQGTGRAPTKRLGKEECDYRRATGNRQAGTARPARSRQPPGGEKRKCTRTKLPGPPGQQVETACRIDVPEPHPGQKCQSDRYREQQANPVRKPHGNR